MIITQGFGRPGGNVPTTTIVIDVSASAFEERISVFTNENDISIAIETEGIDVAIQDTDIDIEVE